MSLSRNKAPFLATNCAVSLTISLYRTHHTIYRHVHACTCMHMHVAYSSMAEMEGGSTMNSNSGGGSLGTSASITMATGIALLEAAGAGGYGEWDTSHNLCHTHHHGGNWHYRDTSHNLCHTHYHHGNQHYRCWWLWGMGHESLSLPRPLESNGMAPEKLKTHYYTTRLVLPRPLLSPGVNPWSCHLFTNPSPHTHYISQLLGGHHLL